MLKNINRFLKYVGLNLVHAKRPKARKPYTVKELVNAKVPRNCVPSPTCCVDEYNAGKTHYVGDGCIGGHEPGPVTDCAGNHIDASPTQDNKVSGPTS